MIGATADNARTEPAKFRSRRRGVRLAFNLPGAVRRQKLAEILAGFASHSRPAVRKLIRPHMLLVILHRIHRPARLQHDDVQSALGENLRRRPARRAGADDANVVHLGRSRDLGHENSPLEREMLQILIALLNAHERRHRIVVLDKVMLDATQVRTGQKYSSNR